MHMFVMPAQFMKRKAKSITWSELGNQNIQGEKVYFNSL